MGHIAIQRKDFQLNPSTPSFKNKFSYFTASTDRSCDQWFDNITYCKAQIVSYKEVIIEFWYHWLFGSLSRSLRQTGTPTTKDSLCLVCLNWFSDVVFDNY